MKDNNYFLHSLCVSFYLLSTSLSKQKVLRRKVFVCLFLIMGANLVLLGNWTPVLQGMDVLTNELSKCTPILHLPFSDVIPFCPRFVLELT